MDSDDADAFALALAREHRELQSEIEPMSEYTDDDGEQDEVDARGHRRVGAHEGQAMGGLPVSLAVEAPPFHPVHRTWHDFEAAVKAYGQESFQLYVVRTTTSVKTRNLRIAELTADAAADAGDAHRGEANEKMLIPMQWRWYSKTMMCTHGWKDRHRGKGKRSSAMIRSTGCPVKMCATLQFNRDDGEEASWQVVVTKHVRTHNHPLSKELYLYYTENRRMYDPELLALGDTGSGAGGSTGEQAEDPESDAGMVRGVGRIVYSMTPKSFASWEVFHKALVEYSVDTHQHFRIRSTISAPARNAKLIAHAAKNGKSADDIAEQLVPDSRKWHSKLLICDFGWKRKSRSKLQQNPSEGNEWKESSQACPAMIMARLQRDAHDNWRVVINRQVIDHNHGLNDIDPRTIRTEGIQDDADHIVLHGDEDDRVHHDVDGAHESSMDHHVEHVELLDDNVDHLNHETPPSPIEMHQEDNEEPMFELSSHDYETPPQLDEQQEQPSTTVMEVVVRVPRIPPLHASWDAFHSTLQQCSEATYQSYRTRTTTSAKGRNQKILEMRNSGKKDSHGGQAGTKPIPEQFTWYSKTLTCTHGWKERRRGSGKRAIQAVRSTSCPVKICATLQFVDANGAPTSADGAWRVVVTKHVVAHNHNLSKELYRHYCDNRRIYDPELLAIDPSAASTTHDQFQHPQASSSSTIVSASTAESHQPTYTSSGTATTTAEMDQNEAYATQQALQDAAYVSLDGNHQAQQQVYSTHSSISLIPFASMVSSASVLLPSHTDNQVQQVYIHPPLFTQAPYITTSELAATQAIEPTIPFYSSVSSESIGNSAKRRDRESAEPNIPEKRPRTIEDVRPIVPSFPVFSMSAPHGQNDTANLPPIWSPENQEQAVVVTDGDGNMAWRVPRLKRRHETWTEFGVYLEAYSAATYQLYRVRTTSSIAARNARITKHQEDQCEDGDEHDDDDMNEDLTQASQLPASYEWYSKTFVCTHGWKTRHRGKGQRVSHSLRSTSCPVKLCVTLQRDPHNAGNWNVVVTKHVLDHNHEISPSVFHSYSTNRRVKDPEVLSKAEQMWREGQPRRKVFEYLKEATNSHILMKDVHNLVQKWQQQQQQQQRQQSIPGLLVATVGQNEPSGHGVSPTDRAPEERHAELAMDELMV